MLNILAAVKEFLHWRRIVAEIQARRLLLDEVDRASEEIDDLEDQVNRARSNGMHALADRLLSRAARLVLYRSRLPDLKERPDIRSTEGHGPSDGERDPEEGPRDTGPDKSMP